MAVANRKTNTGLVKDTASLATVDLNHYFTANAAPPKPETLSSYIA